MCMVEITLEVGDVRQLDHNVALLHSTEAQQEAWLAMLGGRVPHTWQVLGAQVLVSSTPCLARAAVIHSVGGKAGWLESNRIGSTQ